MSIRIMFLFFIVALTLIDTVVPFPFLQTFLRSLILPISLYIMLQKAQPESAFTPKDLLSWITLSIIFHSLLILFKMGT